MGRRRHYLASSDWGDHELFNSDSRRIEAPVVRNQPAMRITLAAILICAARRARSARRCSANCDDRAVCLKFALVLSARCECRNRSLFRPPVGSRARRHHAARYVEIASVLSPRAPMGLAAGRQLRSVGFSARQG